MIAHRRQIPLVEMGVGLVVAAVYLATLSGNHSETEDSVNFAVRIRDEPHSHFFEGAHVVFDWVAWAVYEAVRATGITHDPLRTVQVFDALLAAVTVSTLARVLRTVDVPVPATIVACGILAFSYGFWRNSVDVEVYTLSAALLVASLAAAVSAVDRPSNRSFAVLGLVNGAAVLAHVTNILFGAVAIAALVLARRRAQPRVRVGALFASYLAAASSVVVAVYATAAGVLRLSSPSKFWNWLTAETGTGGARYGQINAAAVKDAIVGSGRALVGGHFALAIGSVWSFVHEHFRDKPLREERYFLRGFSPSVAFALLVVAAVVVLLVLVLAASWLRRPTRPTLTGRMRTLAILCTVWLVVYGLFYAFWDPLNIELWYVFWLPAAILLALPVAGRTPRWHRVGLGTGLVAALLVVNLFGSLLPQRANGRDYWRVRAQWYRDHLHSDDLLISYDYIWSSYLAYLTPARVVDAQSIFKKLPRAQAAEKVQQIADSSHARHVYLSDYDFDPYRGDRAACSDGLGTCANAAALRRLLLPHAHVVARTKLERVWEYHRPADA
jgi:Protein of unknown function (DUF2723)